MRAADWTLTQADFLFLWKCISDNGAFHIGCIVERYFNDPVNEIAIIVENVERGAKQLKLHIDRQTYAIATEGAASQPLDCFRIR